jgi:diguanylate cyclase (GGDEF)-like protein
MPIFHKSVTVQHHLLIQGSLRFVLFGLACVLDVEFDREVIEEIFADAASLRRDARIYELYQSEGTHVVAQMEDDFYGHLLLTVVSPIVFSPTLAQIEKMTRAEEHCLRQEISEYLAPNSDPLTGLLRHKLLEQMFDEEIRIGARTVSLLIMDIKSMKSINDYFGHPLGDRVLQSVAAKLRRTVPARSPVFRYGGEEFAALLMDTDKEEALAVAHRCHQAVATIALPPRSDNVNNPMAIWIGVSTRTNPQAFRPILEDADIALTAAKKMSRYENFSGDILHYSDIPAERQRRFGVLR